MNFSLKKFFGILLILIFLFVLISSLYAIAAANIMPVETYLSDVSVTVVPAIIPPECQHMTFEQIVYIDQGDTPSDLSEMIFGTNGVDIIDGLGGDDCIAGIDKNDTLSGGPGNDVLIAGSKRSTLYGNAGEDILYGSPKKDSFDGGPENAATDTDTCYTRGGSEKSTGPQPDLVNCDIIIEP